MPNSIGPDPGMHFTAEWYLRNLASAEISTVLSPNANWYGTLAGEGPKMVKIRPAGRFQRWNLAPLMRNGDARLVDDEINYHFAIGNREVTREQFASFLNVDANSLTESDDESAGPASDLPITGISFLEAAAYCNWLSDESGIRKDQWCYQFFKDGTIIEDLPQLLEAARKSRDPNDDNDTNWRDAFWDGITIHISPESVSKTGFRLPTLAEWQYACGQGATTRHWFGDSDEILGGHAWFVENSYIRVNGIRVPSVSSGGHKMPNIHGLFDMHGNVSEWVQPLTVMDSDVEGLLLGGAYNSPPHELGMDQCRFASLRDRNVGNGFRIVQTLAESE